MKKLFLLFSITLLSSLAFSQQYKIKFATLAPEGSTWITVMKEYDKAVREESGGRLGFVIYGGGVAGDEKDVLRKIRLGQFHSAGITGNGVGEIAKSARILDAPFFFKNHAEVDYIVDQFDGELRKEFENGGFVLLGWAEVGSVYIISKTPVKKISDLSSIKMWEWEGDPVADATFKTVGINPIQLSITDVLTSLQTGLITGAYASPLAIVSLQWNTATSYLMDYPLTNSSGAVVISKKEFDKLPADLQQILLKHGKTFMRKLTEQSRKDNIKSLETLKKNKMTFIKPDANEVKSYDEIGMKARQSMAGKLYSQDLLTRVEKALADFRAKGGK
ncbi:MAG: TRAP transporter substrate-binding protein DctP [Bacteroidota bacterium]|nr:TRAP transporter substrate-binding protein DctP [Bacteroidota bacterium]